MIAMLIVYIQKFYILFMLLVLYVKSIDLYHEIIIRIENFLLFNCLSLMDCTIVICLQLQQRPLAAMWNNPFYSLSFNWAVKFNTQFSQQMLVLIECFNINTFQAPITLFACVTQEN